MPTTSLRRLISSLSLSSGLVLQSWARGGAYHLAYVNPRQIGRIALTNDGDQFVARERLGPDALDRNLGLVALQKAVGGRDIKSILMDQTVIARIGNIYSDEIRFQAHLHPRGRRLGCQGWAPAGLD
jgi:formamidopyrimidine-DNA glycosylase